MKKDKFIKNVLNQIRQIPSGQVATYGQIAALAGKPRNARQVGRILRGTAHDENLPWHRVLNAQGKIATDPMDTGELQAILLSQEDILIEKGRCKLSHYQWCPQDPHH